MKQLIIRTLHTIFGLFVFALGNYFMVQANIGLAPWDAFSQGLANITGASFGTMVIASGVVILVLDILLKEKIGVGTVLNTLLIGSFINFLNWVGFLPKQENFYIGILWMVIGQLILCLGSFLYIRQGMGCGPRDSLMIALGKRLKKVPIGVVRSSIEGVALLVGWLLGAQVGLGTVISVLTIGLTLQFVLFLFKFDIKAVAHESLIGTWKTIAACFNKPEENAQAEQEAPAQQEQVEE